MRNLSIKKGNLFNQLENRIDNHLIDSSQYDLEIAVGMNTNYYRVRYIDSEFCASEFSPDYFSVPRYSKNGVSITEVENFQKTDLFKNKFPYYTLFKKEFSKHNSYIPDYYAFFQRITDKNNINKSDLLYSFSLPATSKREKKGVLSYDVDIELVRNRYYVVFFKEKVEKCYFQKDESQYMIYEKNDFIKIKNNISDAVINLAIEGGYPLNLLEYIYIMTDGDIKLISQFFQVINNIHNFYELRLSPFFKYIKPNIENDSEFIKELTKYFNNEQEDIDYTYNSKRRSLKRNIK